MPIKSSTSRIIDIADIRDGVIILNNKALRAVLMVSSINFALKSQEEQKAVVYAFQQFLNSLDFPIQIVVQSRQLNIGSYLTMLKAKEEAQTNELLRIQTAEYSEFVKGLVEMANIMKKSFYIIVPFAAIEAKRESVMQKAKNIFKPSKKAVFTEEAFSRYKEQLWQRVDHIANGLSGMGLKLQALNTENILELFYNLYNPND
ncbi:MAG: hypothetical protein ABIG90_00540 [bacterium]